MSSSLMDKPLTLATVCSGIGAPERAAELLGNWRCAFQAEIEPFPRELLKLYYPEAKLYDDFTLIKGGDWPDIDCMVGGTPCQSFSLAGTKLGLTDLRGNLSLEFIKLIIESGTKRAILENVERLATTDLGALLEAITGRDDLRYWKSFPRAGIIEMGPSGYSVAWRILDSQFFGVPQRRRRIFLVIYKGDWSGPAQVLFDSGKPMEEKGHKWLGGYDTDFPQSSLGIEEQVSGDPLFYAHWPMDKLLKAGGPTCQALTTSQTNSPLVLETLADGSTLIRIMTPIEYERCFGYPDNYTLIPGASNSKRIKVLGNSMVIPVLLHLLDRLGQTPATDEARLGDLESWCRKPERLDQNWQGWSGNSQLDLGIAPEVSKMYMVKESLQTAPPLSRPQGMFWTNNITEGPRLPKHKYLLQIVDKSPKRLKGRLTPRQAAAILKRQTDNHKTIPPILEKSLRGLASEGA